MAKKKTDKSAEGREIFESPEALADRINSLEDYIEKHPTVFYSIVGILVLAVAGFFGGRYYIENQNDLAYNEMFQAEYYFQQDSLDLALYGDGNYYGFLDIIDNYGLSDAAELAHFYAGVSFLKKGEYEDAIEYLKGYNGKDLVLQGRAYSLIGDAYVELGDLENAATQMEKAASYKTNKFITPVYLEKLALIYEEMGSLEKSKETYEKIISDYPTSNQAREAKKNKQRLELLTSK